MMKTDEPVRLWRVDLVHRNGYHAPSQLVEAKQKDVHKEVQKMRLRLMDFPQQWSYHLTELSREFNAKRGKWNIL
jgi:hypothetical protein